MKRDKAGLTGMWRLSLRSSPFAEAIKESETAKVMRRRALKSWIRSAERDRPELSRIAERRTSRHPTLVTLASVVMAAILSSAALVSGPVVSGAEIPSSPRPKTLPPRVALSPAPTTGGGARDAAAPRTPVRSVRSATVSAPRVRLRTGGSLNHFPFAQVSRGQVLVIEDQRGDWYKVRVPDSVAVYVHRGYIEADGPLEAELSPTAVEGSDKNEPSDDGAARAPIATIPIRLVTGTVNATRLVVRVGAARRHEALGLLNRGERVEIVGVAGDWLAIRPTAGAFGWVNRRFVTASGAAAPSREPRNTAEDVAKKNQSAVDQNALARDATKPVGSTTKKSKFVARNPGRVSESGAAGHAPRSAAVGERSRVTRREPMTLEEAFAELRALDRLVVARSATTTTTSQNDAATGARLRALATTFQRVRATSSNKYDTQRAQHGLRAIDAIEKRQAKIRDRNAILARVNEAEQALRKELQESKKPRHGVSSNNVSSINTRSVHAGKPDPIVVRGWLTGAGGSIGRQGTHLLKKGREVLYYLKRDPRMASSLASFLNKRVAIKGVVKETHPRYGADLIVVSEVTVLSD